MQRQQAGRIAGILLALVVALVTAMVSIRAQGNDTPIVIMDGSLSIDSQVPWSQFTGSGDIRQHPHANKTVTKVVVTLGGKDQTVSFNNQECAVEIMYAGAVIKFSTGNNGRGLRITPFSAFQNGNAPTRMVHKNPNAKISHVTVTRGGSKIVDAAANGGTKIVISYE